MPKKPGVHVRVKYHDKIVIASIAERKFRENNGNLQLICRGPLHPQGKWVGLKDFPVCFVKNRAFSYYVRTECRKCYNHKRSLQKPNSRGFEQHGLIPLIEMRPFLHEIMRRCGGFRAASRALGIRHSTLFRWVSHSTPLEHMQKTSAIRILNTLQKLRSGEISERPLKKGYHSSSVIRGLS